MNILKDELLPLSNGTEPLNKLAVNSGSGQTPFNERIRDVTNPRMPTQATDCLSHFSLKLNHLLCQGESSQTRSLRSKFLKNTLK